MPQSVDRYCANEQQNGRRMTVLL